MALSRPTNLLDRKGTPATAGTMGLLSPAPTGVTGVRRIGKERGTLGIGREILTGPGFVQYGGDDC